MCGSIVRPWEPGNPAAGTVRVGFAFVPARRGPAIGTVVPHEGGPGYSTTGTGSSYAAMYGPLLDRRNLLLVDQRGTGLSEPIHCPALQDLRMAYRVAAGRCGRKLGDRADDYSSALSADDLAAVIRKLKLGRVDVYGDSYGTFFTQVFAGRHPELVRSRRARQRLPDVRRVRVLPDPGAGDEPRVRGRLPAVARLPQRQGRRSAEALRRGAGAGAGGAVAGRRLRRRRHPDEGRRRRREPGDASRSARRTRPAFYRELTAALRSALDGDRKPLLRLVAEATGGGTDAGPAFYYSEGLDAAVACHDYPQLYDMTSPPGAGA